MPHASQNKEFFAPNFAARHIGPAPHEVADMLQVIGADSLEALIQQTVPGDIRPTHSLTHYIGDALSEVEAIAKMRGLAAQNQVYTSVIGQGYYGTHLPFVIQRNILENPAWYTAYTPYQPEISQGRLEALLNYQTMISELTALDISNASLLDEGTAAAEAMAVARRVGKAHANAFFVDAQCHPQTIAVLRTRAEPLGWQLIVGNPFIDLDATNVFGAIFQYPGTDGGVHDFRGPIAALKAAGAISVMAADPLALVVLTPPGELGADIAIGSTQRFGVPMGFGGPHAAYIAVRDAHKRAIPGRLIGVSVDAGGRAAMRLSLQTREQHIRREKATSNICTAQVLLAVIASMYAVYHGPDGLRHIAESVHGLTRYLASGARAAGLTIENTSYFDTLTLNLGTDCERVVNAALAQRINVRRIDAQRIGISLDETSTPALVTQLLSILGAKATNSVEASPIASSLQRHGRCLQHPVFDTHHSETELLRYMRKLSDRDLALDRAMIPLGSCTMKLNATAEMLPVTWPEFGALHPFAPAEQVRGYHAMFNELSQWLVDITGYDQISLQPNSGAQGEYAGLLAIRAYHQSRGEGHRKICLIPQSAHGTNPASAQMVGMEVVVVACDAAGNVDIADLRAKAEQHSANLSALMVTYPSTHGVFEEQIREICQITHDHGGQVYMDGANMNAQVGVSRPGDFGADVSHLNLHKTFCIPHGGGGPGMGPIGVKAHLAPFLPGHPHLDQGKARADANGIYVGPVSAAPFGSSSILPISYAYILMMGGEGLTRATQVAILSANYIAKRLEPHFPLLYKNHNGRVAHECILDPRAMKDKYGVTVDDIAKRLIDFGFHAPTMSFPVVGTLMIEPTESEAQIELDRFCDAMIQIRAEIDDVANGRFSIDQSPLRHAPHTVFDLAADEWTRQYSRSEGCFPKGAVKQDKYWSPVSRVDNVYGDKNLVCSCPPLDTYRDA